MMIMMMMMIIIIIITIKNRELIERFRNLKALYNLKKNIQCTNIDNHTNHLIIE